MNWTELLKKQAKSAYRAAEGLLALVDDSRLAWKPTSGANWLTVGQLLDHITTACGATCKGFATGDWGVPPEAFQDMEPGGVLPPAEKFPSVASVQKAKDTLAADKRLTLETIANAGEKALAKRRVTAPWDPRERILAEGILESIEHLASHKAQLYYYLKLQGVDVNTGHLWGM
jgi:hypothetical protein